MPRRARDRAARSLRAPAFSLSARLGINLGYFVAAVTLAHLLHPTERGAVAFITVTALVVSAASRVGIDDATSVFAARDVELRPALLANVLLIGALSSATIGGATSALLLGLPQLRPSDVHAADLLLLLLGGHRLVDRHLRLRVPDRLPPVSRVVPASEWSRHGATPSCSWRPRRWSRSMSRAPRCAWTISQALGAVVAVVASLRVAGIGRPRLALLRKTTPFAFRAWAGSFSSFLNARADQTIMGLIWTERSLGIYAVAVTRARSPSTCPGQSRRHCSR